MTTGTFTIDEQLQKEAETLFNNLGITVSDAISRFFRKAIREQAVPFSPVENAETEEEYKGTLTLPAELIAQAKAARAEAIKGRESEYMTEEEIDALVEKSMNENREEKLQARKDFCAGIRRIQAQSVINGTDKMTMDEIDAIIAEVRAEMRAEKVAGIK